MTTALYIDFNNTLRILWMQICEIYTLISILPQN